MREKAGETPCESMSVLFLATSAHKLSCGMLYADQSSDA
jgi:hypothetical protein